MTFVDEVRWVSWAYLDLEGEPELDPFGHASEPMRHPCRLSSSSWCSSAFDINISTPKQYTTVRKKVQCLAEAV